MINVSKKGNVVARYEKVEIKNVNDKISVTAEHDKLGTVNLDYSLNLEKVLSLASRMLNNDIKNYLRQLGTVSTKKVESKYNELANFAKLSPAEQKAELQKMQKLIAENKQA
jgi:metal-sulfur cluster biosynthetic enzyme